MLSDTVQEHYLKAAIASLQVSLFHSQFLKLALKGRELSLRVFLLLLQNRSIIFTKQ